MDWRTLRVGDRVHIPSINDARTMVGGRVLASGAEAIVLEIADDDDLCPVRVRFEATSGREYDVWVSMSRWGDAWLVSGSPIESWLEVRVGDIINLPSLVTHRHPALHDRTSTVVKIVHIFEGCSAPIAAIFQRDGEDDGQTMRMTESPWRWQGATWVSRASRRTAPAAPQTKPAMLVIHCNQKEE